MQNVPLSALGREKSHFITSEAGRGRSQGGREQEIADTTLSEAGDQSSSGAGKLKPPTKVGINGRRG